MNYEETPLFQKEVKENSKKYKSLKDDLRFFKEKVLRQYPEGIKGKKSCILIKHDDYKVIKHRLSSKSLNKMILRVIYIYIFNENKIVFVQLYSKSEQQNHDKKRLKEYSESLISDPNK